jgi:transposase
VSCWFQWWAEFECDGLGDEPRPGRPPKLSAAEQQEAVEIVQEEPRSIKRAVSEIAARLKKK